MLFLGGLEDHENPTEILPCAGGKLCEVWVCSKLLSGWQHGLLVELAGGGNIYVADLSTRPDSLDLGVTLMRLEDLRAGVGSRGWVGRIWGEHGTCAAGLGVAGCVR